MQSDADACDDHALRRAPPSQFKPYFYREATSVNTCPGAAD